MSIKLPDLPFATDALEPHISGETMELHYGKHHRGYVEKLGKLIEGTRYADMPLEQIIVAAREQGESGIFNNAAQVWNHSFFWKSLTPSGQPEPVGRIRDLVEQDFGDIERFKDEFRKTATSHFGSGWTWLVLDDGKLRILSTSDADTPAGTQMTPLLTLDVWEHAYYVDYRNERARYVDAVLDHLINWRFALDNVQVAANDEQQSKDSGDTRRGGRRDEASAREKDTQAA